MNNTQGAEPTVRELLQKNNVRNGDTQRADGRIYQAVVDSQKNAKIVEWVEIRSDIVTRKSLNILVYQLHLLWFVLLSVFCYISLLKQ